MKIIQFILAQTIPESTATEARDGKVQENQYLFRGNCIEISLFFLQP